MKNRLTVKTRNLKNGIILAAALFIVVFSSIIKIPMEATIVNGAGLNHQAQIALGILLFALILWMTEAIPFHITGFIAVLVLALFQRYHQAYVSSMLAVLYGQVSG